MIAAWDTEELAWATDCARAGDTAEDVAEMSGRTVIDVIAHVYFPRLTEQQRIALQMYVAGATLRDIGLAMKSDSTRPDSLACNTVRKLRDRGFTLPDRCPGRSPDAEARRHA